MLPCLSSTFEEIYLKYIFSQKKRTKKIKKIKFNLLFFDSTNAILYKMFKTDHCRVVYNFNNVGTYLL